jgi:hypothetical protein
MPDIPSGCIQRQRPQEPQQAIFVGPRDKLMGQFAKRIKDQRLLKLIRAFCSPRARCGGTSRTARSGPRSWERCGSYPENLGDHFKTGQRTITLDD